MMAQLYRFFIVDEVARWRAASWTFLVIFVYGILFDVIGGRPINDVAHEAALAGAITFAGWLIAYCRNISLEIAPLRLIGKRRLMVAALSAAVLTIVAIFPIGQPIEAAVISRKLKAALNQPDDKALTQARAVIEHAAGTNARANIDLVSAVGERAIAVANNKNPELEDEAWKTISAVVTYRSGLLLPEEARRILHQQLPECFRQIPQFPAEHPRLFGPFLYENCFVQLDKPLPPQITKFFEFVLNPAPDDDLPSAALVFSNCVIGYSGGALPRFFGNLLFTNSLFVFSIDSPPSSMEAMKIVEAILESTSATITIPKMVKIPQ